MWARENLVDDVNSPIYIQIICKKNDLVSRTNQVQGTYTHFDYGNVTTLKRCNYPINFF